MKTGQFARSIGCGIALLGAIGMVGCGAQGFDEGAAGEGEIGVTSQAVTAAEINSSGPALGAGLGKAYASACTVTLSGEDYVMVAGGETSTGGYSRDVYVLRTSSGVWSTFTNKLPTGGASRAQMLPEPGVAGACLHIGGENANGTSNAITELALSVDGTTHVPTAVAANAAGTLATPRSRFKAIECGTSKILVVGGDNSGTKLASMETWAAGPTVAAFQETAANGSDVISLTEARAEFSIARQDSTHIAVFGGVGANLLNGIEKIVVDSNCDATGNLSAAPFVTPKLATTLSVSRKGLEAFYLSQPAAGQAKFVVAAGEAAGAAASNVHNEVLIDWTTTANDAIANSTIPTATRFPALAVIGTGQAFLIGGIGVPNVQEQNAGWTSVATDSAAAALVNREGAAVAVANGLIYAVSGKNGATFLTSTLAITP